MGILGILGSTDIPVSDFGRIAASGNASSPTPRYSQLANVTSLTFSAKQRPAYHRWLDYADDLSISASKSHPYPSTRYPVAKSPSKHPAPKTR